MKLNRRRTGKTFDVEYKFTCKNLLDSRHDTIILNMFNGFNAKNHKTLNT